MEKVLLSVIMPCYNVADTFRRAINSILMQRVDFKYEIIIVDDASTDSSMEIFAEYEKKYDFVHVHRNAQNSGNAETFYQGLIRAQGDFFCVLDGDDFYAIQDKFQRQIDFFRSDVNEEYVATAHRFVYTSGAEFYIPDWPQKMEFNYFDFIGQQTGAYYHTSTYMYRNIFRGNVPSFYRENYLRGDSPRTLFHLKYSNKKVKILPFVGSAYYYNFNGIWSSLDKAKQNTRSINMWSRVRELVDTKYEKEQVDILLKKFLANENVGEGEFRTYDFQPIDFYMSKIQTQAKTYAFRSDGIVFNNIYHDVYIDTLLATLGYTYRAFREEFIQRETNNDIVILAGKLVPNGGGIFKEITEIIEMYQGTSVHILLTDSSEVSAEAVERLNKSGDVKVHTLPETCPSIMEHISKELVAISPCKVYYYAAHDNPYTVALINSGVAKNVYIFSFDHGFICGMDNPNVDVIVAKRQSDYRMLKKYFGSRVVMIPTWGEAADAEKQKIYEPFKSHDNLITACAAARFYKVDGEGTDSYIPMIAELLGKTNGIHYHFGPIPSEKMEEIDRELEKNNVPKDHFVHILWADSLPDSLLENEVDVFIEPFPTISYKISLDVMAVGVPIIGFKGVSRLKNLDFIYDEYMKWGTKEEFIDMLSGIDKDFLQNQSQKAIAYYNRNHDINVIKPYFLTETEFDYPEKNFCSDDSIGNMEEFKLLYSKYISSKSAVKKSNNVPAKKVHEKVIIKTAGEEIADIKSSVSYKLGSFVAYIPWLLKKAIRGECKNGKPSHPWDVISIDESENTYNLQLLRGSTTLRIGRFLTAPFRCLRDNAGKCKKKEPHLHELASIKYAVRTINRHQIEDAKEINRIKYAVRELNEKQDALIALLEKNNQINSEILQVLASINEHK